MGNETDGAVVVAVTGLPGKSGRAGRIWRGADTDSVTVGTVGSLSGVSTNTGNVTLTALNAGDLTLAQSVSTAGFGAASAPSGVVTLTASAGGAVNETGGAAVVADQLAVTAVNASSLTSSGNNVAVLAANLSGAGAAFSYTDADSFKVGTAGSLSGVSTNAGNVTLTALGTGDLTLAQSVSTAGFGATSAPSGIVSLDASAGGAVNETGGAAIVADQLAVTAVNASSLTSNGNNVAVLAANLSGAGAAFRYTDTNSLTVGTVASLSGVSSNAGNVTLTALGTGDLTLAQSVSTAGFGATSAPSGVVTLDASAGGAVNETGGAAVVAGQLAVTAVNATSLTSNGNNVAVLATNLSGAGAAFSYTDTDSFTVGTVGSVSGVSTNAGNVTLTALGTGDLTLAQSVCTAGFGATSAPSGIVSLDVSAGGAVNETGGAAIVADQLAVTAVNASSLTSSGNNVAVVAANLSGAGAALSYTDADSFAVGTVGSLSGVSANAGNITLTALNAGDLTLAQSVSTAGFGAASAPSGVVTLDASAGGAVNETGGAAVVTNQVAVTAVNASSLTSSGNNVAVLAANLSGAGAAFSYTDTDSFTVGTVGSLSGIATNVGNITILAGGALQINGDIRISGLQTALSTVDGQIDLRASDIEVGATVSAKRVSLDVFGSSSPAQHGQISGTPEGIIIASNSRLDPGHIQGPTGTDDFALKLSGSASSSQNRGTAPFGTPNTEAQGLRISLPDQGWLLLEPHANTLWGTSPYVYLWGAASVPLSSIHYEFKGLAGNVQFAYNNVLANTPEIAAALLGGLAPVRESSREVLAAGFSKENVSKQVTDGSVVAVGATETAVDNVVGTGVVPPFQCKGFMTHAEIGCQ
ncbi:MAG: hypothetical protein KF778_14140 [Rhodocyclaceae bacterium]|nr:hypothetical protein [Rhodocyclaceae bacterium]